MSAIVRKKQALRTGPARLALRLKSAVQTRQEASRPGSSRQKATSHDLFEWLAMDEGYRHVTGWLGRAR